jgi:hypothetical protein
VSDSVLKPIVIVAGDCGRTYQAKDGRDAIKMFFRDITQGRIKLCQLSPIASWKNGTDEAIYFRVAPALFKAGLMSLAELDATLRQTGLEFTAVELRAMAIADSWMLT